MPYTFSVVINVLPVISQPVILYGQAINNSTNALSSVTITSSSVLYGNVALDSDAGVTWTIPHDTNPFAILCITTLGGTPYQYIFYSNAVYFQELPNNFNRLSEKIPLGVFSDISSNSIIGQIVAAKAKMIDDYYQSFFFAQNQVYSTDYSQQLEFEYNGTSGLLSNSIYPNDLFHLFSTMLTYGLNAYDLELFISQYIYFRIGHVCAAYVTNDPSPIEQYWIIGILGFTQFDQTIPQTVIAPDSFAPQLTNLEWTIFNSTVLTTNFKTELENLINRIARADIGNIIGYVADANPGISSGFTLIGPTYRDDPRLITGKCLEYTGQDAFPLNIIGYKKN